MEKIDNATVFSRVTQPAALCRRLRALRARIRAALKAAGSRRELLRMDDHMRADIGISRGEALMESRRMVWDTETPRDPSRIPR
jgi:uncharacterized protein YjiS (DUF1127 family)